MHGLQACLFKYITVAAFRIYLSVVKVPLKGEVGGHVLRSHGNYIFAHGKIMEFSFLNFCGNLEKSTFLVVASIWLRAQCFINTISSLRCCVHMLCLYFFQTKLLPHTRNASSGSTPHPVTLTQKHHWHQLLMRTPRS